MSPDWRGDDKDRTREILLRGAVDRLRESGGRPPEELRALVLVDGRSPQTEDLRTLTEVGLRPSNIWALSRKWVPEVMSLYGEAHCVQQELSEFLAGSDLPVFDIAYLDFCKSLPSEGAGPRRERHAASLFHLFRRRRLAERSVLITNFSVAGYFDDPHYRDFMVSYVSPDRGPLQGGGTYMSVKTIAFGGASNFMGSTESLLDRKRKATSPGDTSIQEAQTLMAGIDGFVRDLAEVYVPSVPFRDRIHPRVLAVLDEVVGPENGPEEFRRQVRSLIFGRAAVCARLIESLDPELRTELEPFTGRPNHIWGIASLSDQFWMQFAAPDVYELGPPQAWPYPFPIQATRTTGDAHTMLPIMWSVRMVPLVNSIRLWGEPCTRRREGLRESLFRFIGPVFSVPTWAQDAASIVPEWDGDPETWVGPDPL